MSRRPGTSSREGTRRIWRSCDVGTLRLPDLQIDYTEGGPSGDLLVLVAGGRAPTKGWMRSFFPEKRLWCADSGLVACLRAGFTPERLVGDGDSTPSAAWELAEERGVVVERHSPHKDFTDLQLALFAAGRNGCREVVVTGCWGGRFDHLFSAVFSSLWAEEEGAVVRAFADHKETLLLLRGGETAQLILKGRRDAVLSLLSLSAVCSGVGLRNTLWELEGERLFQGRPFSVSNRPGTKGNPTVTVGEGLLGVYLTWAQ